MSIIRDGIEESMFAKSQVLGAIRMTWQITAYETDTVMNLLHKF